MFSCWPVPEAREDQWAMIVSVLYQLVFGEEKAKNEKPD